MRTNIARTDTSDAEIGDEEQALHGEGTCITEENVDQFTTQEKKHSTKHTCKIVAGIACLAATATAGGYLAWSLWNGSHAIGSGNTTAVGNTTQGSSTTAPVSYQYAL